LDHDPVWYNPDGFKGALQKLKEFHDQYLEKPGPPRHLGDWLQCYTNGTEAQELWDDNLLVVLGNIEGIRVS